MKYLFISIALVSLSFNSIAQNSGYTYEPFGHTTSYEQGYYYSVSGEKVSGLIRWQCSGYSRETGANYILFKPATGEKKIRLTTKEVKAFIIGKDSFAITESIVRSGMTQYDKDFSRVVVTGALTLYSHCQETHAGGGSYGMTSTGIECFYFIRKEGVLYRLKRKDFKDNISFLFGDDKILMNEINNGVLSFDNLEQIVAEYNERKAKQ